MSSRTRKHSKRKYLFLFLVVVVGYTAYSQIFSKGGGGGFDMSSPVNVAEVLKRDVQQWHTFSGRLVAVDEVEVRPRVGGVITKVHFKDGAMVKKGQSLFTIDPRPYAAEVARAEGAYASAQAQSVLANTEYDRGERLYKEKAISKNDNERRRNAKLVADAAVKSARGALETAKLNLEYTKVLAPISGRMGRVEVTEGNLVQTNTGAPVLTTIVSNDPIYADFDADEKTYLQYVAAHTTGNDVAKDIPVIMSLGEGAVEYKGHIHSFDNRLSAASGTIRMRSVFDNPDGLLVPGLFARVRVGAAGGDSAVLVTDRAIGTDQDKKYVMVVGEDNKVQYRVVKLGGMADGLRIVTEGLSEGEKIVLDLTLRIRPGASVKPEVVAMDAPPASEKQETPEGATGEKEKTGDAE